MQVCLPVSLAKLPKGQTLQEISKVSLKVPDGQSPHPGPEDEIWYSYPGLHCADLKVKLNP